jgi:hypothetical protein
MQAAADVVLSYTYGDRVREFQPPGVSDEKRAELERECKNRIRRDGMKWKIGEGRNASTLDPEHWVIKEFKRRTGNQKAGVADFIRACEDAIGAHRLGYRVADPGSRNRLPAGYHIVVCLPQIISAPPVVDPITAEIGQDIGLQSDLLQL